MKTLISIVTLFITSLVFSQKSVDTIIITNVYHTVENGDTTFFFQTSDLKTSACHINNGFEVGKLVWYFDNETKNYVTKEEYENSLYYVLRGTELERHILVSKPVKSVNYELSEETIFKYKVFTDSEITYYTNYPPKNGEIVFYLTEIGTLVKN